MGTDGIEYMLQATEGLPVDVRFMLPSFNAWNRPWTSPARPWTTGPSTPSMTTPGSRDWRR